MLGQPIGWLLSAYTLTSCHLLLFSGLNIASSAMCPWQCQAFLIDATRVAAPCSGMAVKENSCARTPRQSPGCSKMTLPISPRPLLQADADAAASAPRPETVLDSAALANLAQLDPTGANKLMQRVLNTYRSSMARLLAQLAQARAQPDPATMRLVAHTLKSSSASVGALALAALCGEAETALRESHLTGVPDLLDQLVAESARVDAAVLQLLADL